MVIALAIGLGLLIAVRFSLAAEFGIGQRDAWNTILRTILFWIPFYLGLAIPVSLFCGLLLGLDRMIQARELVVLQASGLPPNRLMRPALLLTLLSTLLAIGIYGWLEPLTTYARRVFNHHIEHTAAYYTVEQQTFMKFGRSVVFLDDLDRATGSFGRIFIHHKFDDDRQRTVTGRNGKFEISGQNNIPTLHLEDTITLDILTHPMTNADDTQHRFRVSSSRTLTAPVGNKLTPFRPRGHDQKEWTLSELAARYVHRTQQTSERKVSVELHFRLAEVLLVSILPMLALIFSGIHSSRHTWFRFGAGIVVLIFAYNVLLYGRQISNAYPVSPLFTMWVPLLLATIYVAVHSYSILYRPNRTQ